MDKNTPLPLEGGKDRKTLSIPDAAKALGIGRSAAYEAARTGQIPTIKIGRRVLVPTAAFERLLEQAGKPATQSSADARRAG